MKLISLSQQAAAWNAKIGQSNVKIGIRVKRNAISNQLITILEELKKHERIDAKALVKTEELERDEHWYENELRNQPIITYSEREFEELHVFDAVILLESDFDLYQEFPPTVIKIGLPHGVDVPLEQTIITYGGGYYSDYILGMTNKFKPDPSRFRHLFPPRLRSHALDCFYEIPVGIPKLDRFIDAVTEQASGRPPAIVHHLSNLGIEPPESLRLIVPTLRNLLDHFPNHQIVFRPTMSDRHHPIIQACKELGSDYKNFYFSDSESYITDYAAALAMVCHRPYKLHLFGLATGRPTFLCHPEHSPIVSDDTTFISCPESQMVNQLKAYLGNTKSTIPLPERLERCRNAGLYNPGSSVQNLVESIDRILRDQTHPSWTRYSLTSDYSGLDLKAYIALQVISAKPGNISFLAYFQKYPENPEALLFAADSYARKDFILKKYFYKLSLLQFHKLVQHEGMTPALEASITRWWTSRGQGMLDHILEEAKSDSMLLTNEIIDLRNRFSTHQEVDARPADNGAGFMEFQTLIDLKTFTTVNYTGPLVVYGSKILAQDFLSHGNTHAINVESVVDPLPEQQGRTLAGHIVQAPETLLDDDVPILICSYNYLLEGFIDLRKRLGEKRRLYAICKDRHIADLLPLLATMTSPAPVDPTSGTLQ
ncbi:putative protein OS=Castellaniella defragrans (strain DSM / CCUG 39792 / 65Phen) OX=1437824 GN=BN940_10756 PE=4 SV=1 [Castellaniella denitrificans]